MDDDNQWFIIGLENELTKIRLNFRKKITHIFNELKLSENGMTQVAFCANTCLAQP